MIQVSAMSVCMIKVKCNEEPPLALPFSFPSPSPFLPLPSPPSLKTMSLCRLIVAKLSVCVKCDCPPHAPQLPVFCCKMWTEETTQDSSRRVGSSGPRSGQVRGQRLCQTQVGHGEEAANGGSVAASPPRLHSTLPPTITIAGLFVTL